MLKRFFIASGCPIATTTLYRCIHLQEQLQLLGYEVEVAEWFLAENVDADAALRHDAIFLYRLPMSPALRNLIDTAHAAHKLVVFDTDDLIFAPELIQWHRGVLLLNKEEQRMYAEGVRCYLATLQAVDAVTTATPFLAQLAQEKGQQAFVHRNALGNEMIRVAERLNDCAHEREPRDNVVIGYGSGTPTHDVDFEEVAPALGEILSNYSQAELWLAGPLAIPPALERFASRLRLFPLTSWQDWFELQSRMDIALAPLERNNIFCRGKSEIKFIESGAVGVPLVASRTEPFHDVIQEGITGFLASDKHEWVETLATLMNDPGLRRHVGDRARQTVLDRYSPEARSRELAALLRYLTNDQMIAGNP